MNIVFKGGMGSFLLFHLLYFFFLIYNEKNDTLPSYSINEEIDNNNKILNDIEIVELNKIMNNKNKDFQLGEFILMFFYFYGLLFDYNKYGFQFKGEDKYEIITKNITNNELLVKNINHPNIVIGTKCSNYSSIKNLFKDTFIFIRDKIRN